MIGAMIGASLGTRAAPRGCWACAGTAGWAASRGAAAAAAAAESLSHEPARLRGLRSGERVAYGPASSPFLLPWVLLLLRKRPPRAFVHLGKPQAPANVRAVLRRSPPRGAQLRHALGRATRQRDARPTRDGLGVCGRGRARRALRVFLDSTRSPAPSPSPSSPSSSSVVISAPRPAARGRRALGRREPAAARIVPREFDRRRRTRRLCRRFRASARGHLGQLPRRERGGLDVRTTGRVPAERPRGRVRLRGPPRPSVVVVVVVVSREYPVPRHELILGEPPARPAARDVVGAQLQRLLGGGAHVGRRRGRRVVAGLSAPARSRRGHRGSLDLVPRVHDR